MASFQKPANYNLVVAGGIPSSILPWAGATPPAAVTRTVIVQNNTGAVSGGGQLQFMMPSGANSFIKAGSMYLKCTVRRDGGSANNWTFSGPAASASSIINRLTVSLGGVAVERVDAYNLLHQALLIHASSSGYYAVDSVVLGERVPTGGTNLSYDVCLPIMSQLLNNSGQCFPLWAVGAGSAVVTMDLNNVTEAIVETSTVSITGFTVLNAQLVFDLIDMSPEYINSMKSELNSGKSYNIAFMSSRNINVADATTVPLTIPLQVSSLRGVLFISRAAKTQTNAGNYVSGTISRARLYCDGGLVNNVEQDNVQSQFAALNSFLGKINDTNMSSCGELTLANYPTTYFVGAIGTQVYPDAGYAMGGRAVSSIQVEIQKTVAQGQSSFFPLYDTLLSIQAGGLCSVAQ